MLLLLIGFVAPARAGEPEIRVSAGFPATLLYALDAAAGERNRDAGYRAWIVDGDENPEWLRAYAARRRLWNGVGPQAREGAPSYEICAWESADLEPFVACVREALPSGDAEVAERALRAAAARLGPRWPALRRRVDRLVPPLEAALRGDGVRALLAELRASTGLAEDARLDVRVVLVAKPDSRHWFGHQWGPYMVHEVGRGDAPGPLLAAAMHEVAHLAHARSPWRASMEAAFAELGDDGLFVANAWDEAVATAFGNGLAAARLDPGFREDAQFYADPVVDALGRALYRAWREGGTRALGPALAADLVRLARAAVPAEKRTVDRHLWYATVYGKARDALLRAVRYRNAAQFLELHDDVPAGRGLPPWAARVVLATRDELAARPALLARLGVDAPALDAALDRGAAVLRPDAALFVVVARAGAELKAAARAFSKLPKLPARGWTPLPPD